MVSRMHAVGSCNTPPAAGPYAAFSRQTWRSHAALLELTPHGDFRRFARVAFAPPEEGAACCAPTSLIPAKAC